MSALKDAVVANAPTLLPLTGLVIGFLFGALVTRSNFCTMGALSDWRNLGDTRRLRAWLLAIAVAVAGTQLLATYELVALERSMYLAPRLNWAGNLIGGAMFGVGMVYAGGCASRNLARVGGGDLRALVTLLLIGVFAYVAIGGVLGPARAALEQATAVDLTRIGIQTQSLGDVLGRWAAPVGSNLALGLGLSLVLALWCLRDADFRASPWNVAAGVGIGLLVVAGWAMTGLAFDELADKPVQLGSLTFVRPTGDTIEWLGRYTALGLPGFGVASVFGAVAGAFAVSVATGRFRVQTFADAEDALRNMAGAALMGIGGVMALGCTVGQGITGISTLAIGGILALAGIVAGAHYAFGRLERSLAVA